MAMAAGPPPPPPDSSKRLKALRQASRRSQRYSQARREQLDRLWTLAAAQYIPNKEMVDPRWTRGTLSRQQIEIVAARVSQLRECFY